MDILRGTLRISSEVDIYTNFMDMYTNCKISTCKLKFDMCGFLVDLYRCLTKTINSFSIFHARKCDVWSKCIQWIYIDVVVYF